MLKVKVGIADDNRDFCEILTGFLRKQEEIEISFIAHDGLQTVEEIKKQLPDVLILDMIMPHMDGLGVLEGISGLELSEFPKIIVLSAVGQESFTRKAISKGADYYIVKPFNLNILLKRINQLAGNEQEKENDKKDVIERTVINNHIEPKHNDLEIET
jgi:two-component system response regulator (stage 0 sporulation protein A)